jgi:hypothetical protein
VKPPVDRAASENPVRRWLRLWRVERVEVVSPLSTDAVEARLAAGLTSRRQLLMGPLGNATGRVVSGRVSRQRIRLTARRWSMRNSWSPVFRGQLVPAGAGCRLVGTLGWHRFTRVFTALWLGLVGLFLVGGGLGFVVLVAAGHFVGSDVLLVLVPAGMFCFGAALVAAGGSAGWRDGAFLRGWLAEQLQT